MSEKDYPKLIHRIKAAFVDFIILLILLVVISIIFSSYESVSDNIRIVAFVFVFGLYDPIFTSAFGGTLGHMLVGIRVKRESNESRNIILPKAIIRFLTKVLLGWISLLTVTSNEYRKAIHDSIIGSIVVYR